MKRPLELAGWLYHALTLSLLVWTVFVFPGLTILTLISYAVMASKSQEKDRSGKVVFHRTLRAIGVAILVAVATVIAGFMVCTFVSFAWKVH